jgi:hypothetical protein
LHGLGERKGEHVRLKADFLPLKKGGARGIYPLMDLQKLTVKFFTMPPDRVPLTDFIEIFHGWIQATDGIYHDVADYSHMKSGPGIVLVAQQANLHIDETGGRRGLLYCQKAPLSGANHKRLRTVLRTALENCHRLEREPALQGRIRFSGDEVLITVNDRLPAPNDIETYERLKPELELMAAELFRPAKATINHKQDPRQRFSVAIRAFEPLSLDALIANLNVGITERDKELGHATAKNPHVI